MAHNLVTIERRWDFECQANSQPIHHEPDRLLGVLGLREI